MSGDAGELKENTAGAPPGDLAGAGESEAQRRGKERWAKMTDAEKAEHHAKAKAGRERAKKLREAKKRGDRSADDAPRPKSSKARPASEETRTGELAMIKEGLDMLLTAPAMVGTIKGDPWLTDHFLTRGPVLSAAIVEEAARNDQFRAYLLRLVGVLKGASLIGALGMYVVPVAMHMGAMPNLLGVPVVGAPPRGAPPAQPHFVAPERGPAEGPLDEEAIKVWAAEEAEDGFAQELDDARQNGGGVMPPLPMEPV